MMGDYEDDNVTNPGPEEYDACIGESVGGGEGGSVEVVGGRRAKKTLFRVDRENCCIVLLLVLLLIGIVGALAFGLGQWSVYLKGDCAHEELELPFNSTEERQGQFLVQAWRKRKQKTLERLTGEPIVQRLPKNPRPLHYNIHLNLTEYNTREVITGNVTILLECSAETNRIVFHAASSLHIRQIKIVEVGEGEGEGEDIRWLSMERNPNTSLVIISTKDSLRPHRKYDLFLDFLSPICDVTKCKIFCYRKRHHSGLRHPVFISSKFEPHGARTFIPCWDEPEFKAVFKVTVTHPAITTVLCNAALFRKEWPNGDHITTIYRETPLMSTYLLAIVAGDSLVNLEKETSRGVKIRVWTMSEDAFKAEFALEFAANMFEILEEHFVVKYPLSKLDFVASRNYPVGAMENYGLIIFHHKLLLLSQIDHLEGSGEWLEGGGKAGGGGVEEGRLLLDKFKISKIIVHELLHQWFGNLVTMTWWGDIWLNEGFSTFFNYKFLQNSYPLLVDHEYFFLLMETMKTQSEEEKFSLVRNFSTHGDINRAFHIHHLYTKGCIITKMLSDMMGGVALRGGLIDYLQSKAFSTATTSDLWQILGRANTLGDGSNTIEQVMKSWVENPGFPELEVKRLYRTKSLSIKQIAADAKRHKSHHSDHSPAHNSAHLWTIPITYMSSKSIRPTQPFWLETPSLTVKAPSLSADRWLLVNPSFQFPIRVNYDIQNWAMLIQQLHFDPLLIPEKSRVQLVFDSDHFLQHSPHFIQHVILLGYLKNETKLLPLFTGLNALHSLLHSFKATKIFPLLLLYYRPVVHNLVKIQEQSTSGTERAVWGLERSGRTLQFYNLACALHQNACQVDLGQIHHFLTNPASFNDDVLSVKMCYYLHQEATQNELFLIEDGLRIANNGKQHLVVMAMCTRDSGLHSMAVDYLIRTGNAGYILSALSQVPLLYNEQFRLLLWERVGSLGGEQMRRLFQRESLADLCLQTAASTRELEEISRVIPGLEDTKAAIHAELNWIEKNAAPPLEQWMLRELKIN